MSWLGGDATVASPCVAWFRAVSDSRGDRAAVKRFALSLQEALQVCNPRASAMKHAYNQDIFYRRQAPPVPPESIHYATRYLESLAAPWGEEENLLLHLQARLQGLLQRTELDAACEAEAKSVTGLMAQATRLLYTAESPPLSPWGSWEALQCLHEYQIRQLIETAVFAEESLESPKRTRLAVYGSPPVAPRVRLPRFVDWIASMPGVASMAGQVSQNIAAYASDPRFMQLDAFWARRLRDRHPGALEDIASLGGLLAPALEMVAAMESCSTPCQKAATLPRIDPNPSRHNLNLHHDRCGCGRRQCSRSSGCSFEP